MKLMMFYKSFSCGLFAICHILNTKALVLSCAGFFKLLATHCRIWPVMKTDKKGRPSRQTPSRILFQRERVAQLLKNLDALAEAERELILLAKVEGLTIGEMSQLLGKGKTQISLSLHRALKHLRSADEAQK
jgi:hypothetical protein